MDTVRASALIRQHRYWLSKESDYAVARHAEHAYAHVAASMCVIAVGWVANGGSPLLRFMPSILALVFASFCYWRSQQFVKIRREFETRWPQNLSDLDAGTKS